MEREITYSKYCFMINIKLKEKTMQEITIKSREGKVIISGKYESIKDCLEKNRNADLSYANLSKKTGKILHKMKIMNRIPAFAGLNVRNYRQLTNKFGIKSNGASSADRKYK